MMTIMMIIVPGTLLPAYTLILTGTVMAVQMLRGNTQLPIVIIQYCQVYSFITIRIVTMITPTLNPVQQKFAMGSIMIVMAKSMKVLSSHFGIWMRMEMGSVIQVTHTCLTRAALSQQDM